MEPIPSTGAVPRHLRQAEYMEPIPSTGAVPRHLIQAEYMEPIPSTGTNLQQDSQGP
jgi:hypothetical protein